MCGICGIFDFKGNSIDQAIVQQMKSAILHRGPDGEGEFFDKEVGLGHRRLSIIDVGGGGQPIGNEDGSIQVVFNGEIYNFIELREELQKYGHQFRTHSDTEVIVHAYEQWGIQCVKRFNGMFAFALWDGNKRELFLARDHLGIKPLYYVILGSQLLFASEIKSLLQHKNCPREVDIDALAELFSFRYVPSPKTLFKNIMKLPPAHTLVVSQAGIRIERFWEWGPTERKTYKEADLIEEYQDLLEDAVRLQLRSDVPLGLFLSSGVDSGMLLAIMSKHTSKAVQTFTIGFEDGEKTNEVEDAKILAQMFGADHYHQILGPSDYLNYYERYMWDLEEPVGNETAAAFYFVAKLTSQHVKVALTGQGADEPWAGYDRHKGAKLSGLYSQLPGLVTNNLASLIISMPGRMERLKRGVVSLAEPDMLTRLTKIYSFFSADMKGHLYTGALKQAFDNDYYGTRHALSRLQNDVKHLDPLTQILYLDTRANLPDDLLMVGDKTSMANSLEARVPFLDYRLVQFIESLPPNLKLKGFNGKYLHKKSAEKWLPKEIVHRKKKGFANPIENWFRVGMKSYVEECLLSSDSAMARYFDQGYIRKILELDRSGKEQYRRQIYLLVSLELWHRKFMSN
ncbi:asparagine synthetase [Methyloglobulus morosus KoM1]|uniref:asparagine synthase (glutamine-hydrolyzing) n=1 Tax=Methyloglobulus morosus KoM1 TaxID=1116472 RepID=V5C6S0_9GAMM|nr:asparagine synthase (glutamine-hydrolyzing) [Methyloglobulus morosus]ESS72453.1 asparagine synthetase [Methyloglobulus morosus KoM1]